MSAEIKLAPCECGEPARLCGGRDKWSAGCGSCDAETHTLDTAAEAVLAWNRMALAAEAFELIEKLAAWNCRVGEARALLARVQPEPEGQR